MRKTVGRDSKATLELLVKKTKPRQCDTALKTMQLKIHTKLWAGQQG